MTLGRTLISSIVLQNEATSFVCMQLRAGVDIREGEQGFRLGAPFFQRCGGAPLWDFRTWFLHCFV